ncbi:hypothetical protein G114_16755 [Aeromonas diversa CDC 2478-85]|uniref:DUF2726 domain-containing protein n=1 Tax=Aeromonas diversa CDC 2478-85 TaxID=1268237 RepID=N9TXF6_9GAMM|nr:DUF2726 domain-containing protein [Aeromonas diversa]ENY70725.1 hypothetical protein G114_16755 [Aeromonas diversa CDC 2478-85]
MGLVWLAMLMLLVAGLLWWMRRGGAPSDYQRQDGVLEADELALLDALEEAVGQDARVLCKVNLANVLAPSERLNARKWQRASDELTCWDLDYVLIDREEGTPLCGIVIEEEEGHAADFRRLACKAAGLALLAIPLADEYDVARLRSQIYYYLEPELGLGEEEEPEAATMAPLGTHHEREFADEPQFGPLLLDGIDTGGRREPTLNPELIGDTREERAPTITRIEQTCPRCDAPLVERLARKGPKAGHYFMTCTRFPECRYAALTGRQG